MSSAKWRTFCLDLLQCVKGYLYSCKVSSLPQHLSSFISTVHSFVSHFPCLFLSLNASQLLKQSIATSRKKSKKPLYLPPSVASSRFPPNRRGTSKTAPTPKRTLPGHSASRLTLPGRFKKLPKSSRSPQVPTRVKVCETDIVRIRLSVSTASRTYELSEDTYVIPFRTDTFHSTGLCNNKP